MEANCIVDIDISAIEEQILSAVPSNVPKEVFGIIEEFTVPYNKEAAASELIGSDPKQHGVLKWILDNDRWGQEEVEECLTEALYQDDNEEMRGVIVDFIKRKGMRVSSFFVQRAIEEENARNVNYLIQNMRWFNYEMNRFLKQAFGNESIDITSIILQKQFEVCSDFWTHCVSICSNSNLIRAVFSSRYRNETDGLQVCFRIAIQCENTFVVETLLNSGLARVNSSDLELLKGEIGREMFQLLKGYSC